MNKVINTKITDVATGFYSVTQINLRPDISYYEGQGQPAGSETLIGMQYPGRHALKKLGHGIFGGDG